MGGQYRSAPFRREAAQARQWAAIRVVAFALTLTGCSVAPQDDGIEATGSIKPVRTDAGRLSPDLDAEDRRRANGALGLALDPQGNGTTVKWENAASGAEGAFTPVAQPYVKADEICRAFIAAVTTRAGASSLQGSACRLSGDAWEIRDLRPFSKAS